MEEMIHELLKRWERAACNGMGNDFPKEEYFLELTKETFKLLSCFNAAHTITNPVARILVLMQEYAVYCFISDKAHSIEMWSIVSGILYDFLNGFEQCKIETLTADILRDIGVPAHIKCYHYLREAIIIAVEDMDVINALTKVLYPQVARTFQTTPTRVARAIQHAIEISWDRREQNGLVQFFGYTVNKREDKPSVAEFLAVIVDNIQRTMRTP